MQNISQETSTLHRIKQDYEQIIESIVHDISQLPSVECRHYHFFNDFLDNIRISDISKMKRFMNSFKNRCLSQEKYESLDILFNAWKNYHTHFEELFSSCIESVINTHVHKNEFTDELTFYIESLHLEDVLECINILTVEDNEYSDRLFIPTGCRRTTSCSVLMFHKNEKQQCQHIKFQDFHEWMMQTINRMDSFNLSSDTQSRLIEYLQGFPISLQLDILEYFQTDDIIYHSYMVPSMPQAKVIVFRVFQSQIVDIQFVDRDEWIRIRPRPVVQPLPEMRDVRVIISKDQYKNLIDRKRLTKKMIKEQNIPEACCICLENFKVKNQIHKTPCGHYFHALCLRKQLCTIGPPRCALCRHDVRDAVT